MLQVDLLIVLQVFGGGAGKGKKKEREEVVEMVKMYGRKDWEVFGKKEGVSGRR